jgi:hypothetical protein
VLLLYVLYACVFWLGEAESLELRFQPGRTTDPTAREPGRWVFDFLRLFEFAEEEK